MAIQTFADHVQTGDHASRPAATAVAAGTLYSCSDHGLIYQSDGATWSTYATLAGGGAPAAHATSHQSGGGDAIKLDDLAAPDDNTDLDASTTKHGLLKKLSNVATEYMDGTGAWSTPAGGGGGSGAVVQVVNTQTGAVATGSTVMPLDDTIPQNTEGTEFMTLAITPTDAANKLKVEVVALIACNTTFWAVAGLFQDTTAGALAATFHFEPQTHGARVMVLTHWVTAGTTSATTFKFRAGPHTAGGGNALTFNGNNAARQMGGVAASSITITEIVP